MICGNSLGKVLAALCFFAYVSFACAESESPAVPTLPVQGSLQAAFAPWDDVEGMIKNCIDQARKQVLVHAYLLTNKKITAALVSAKRRGVDVRVLADARKHAEVPSSRLAELAAAGIDVRLEAVYENAHNKVIIIDADTPHAIVITGSFNFSWTAQHRNAENILIARNNPALAGRYEMNWQRHQQAAVPFRK